MDDPRAYAPSFIPNKEGKSIPHNLDPAASWRPRVLQRTHLARDPPGSSDLLAEL